MTTKNNSIIVLMGEACSGKDTTLRNLVGKYDNFYSCVSHTTRPMREGESEGKEYYFIDGAEFESMYSGGEFIETRSYKVTNDEMWFYGLSEQEIATKLEKGHVVVILDVQGYKELVDYYLSMNADINIHAFYIKVEETERWTRYIRRQSLAFEVMKEAVRRFEADREDFKDVEHIEGVTTVYYPSESHDTLLIIENFLLNRGIDLKQKRVSWETVEFKQPTIKQGK